ARSVTVDRRHGPSNASLAAATAASTSAPPASARVSSGVASNGLMVCDVPPSAASVHFPPTYRYLTLPSRSPPGARSRRLPSSLVAGSSLVSPGADAPFGSRGDEWLD